MNPELDLSFDRVVDVKPELVWKAWTTPEYVVKWFTPAPWKTVHCEIDLKPGGKFHTVMESPEGQQFRTPGATSNSCRTGSSCGPVRSSRATARRT